MILKELATLLLRSDLSDRERRLIVFLADHGGRLEYRTGRDLEGSGLARTHAHTTAQRLHRRGIIEMAVTGSGRVLSLKCTDSVQVYRNGTHSESSKINGFTESVPPPEGPPPLALSPPPKAPPKTTHTGRATASGHGGKGTKPAVCEAAGKGGNGKPPAVSMLTPGDLEALGISPAVAMAAKAHPKLWGRFTVTNLQRLQATRGAENLAHALDVLGCSYPDPARIQNPGALLGKALDQIRRGEFIEPPGYVPLDERTAPPPKLVQAQEEQRQAQAEFEEAARLWEELETGSTKAALRKLKADAKKALTRDGIQPGFMVEPIIRAKMLELHNANRAEE